MTLQELILALKLESALQNFQNKWIAIGGNFDIDKVRKQIIIRQRTTSLSLTEAIDMQEDIENERIREYLSGRMDVK